MNIVKLTYYDIASIHTYFLIAINDDVYKEVVDQYEKDEIRYKKRIKELETMLKMNFIAGLPVDLKWRTLTTISVLERFSVEEERAVLVSYVKKIYKRIYDFAQMNPQLNFGLAQKFIHERYGELPDAIINCLISVYYISLPKIQPIIGDSPIEKHFINNYIIDTSPTPPNIVQIDDETKVEAIKLFTSLTNKKWRGFDPMYLDKIFGEIEQKTISENPKVQREIRRTGSLQHCYGIEPLKYVRFGQSIFQILGLDNLLMYTKLLITKDEWCYLYLSVKSNQELKNFKEEDLPMMMCYALLFFAQNKLYQQLAEMYKEQMYSVSTYEIKQAREKFEEEQKIAVKELEAQSAVYIAQINQLAENVTSLQQEKEVLEKQVKRLQMELEKQQSKAELSERLLETVFNETSQDISEENDISLPDKVVYVGGHPALQKQLKERFSNWYFIAVDELQRGEQQVKQADLVIFNSHHNNHAQFERLKDLLRTQRVLFAKYGSNIQLHIKDVQMQYLQIQQKLGV